MNKEEYYKTLFEEHQTCPECPNPREVVDFFKKLCGLLFQDYGKERLSTLEEIKAYESSLKDSFTSILSGYVKFSVEDINRSVDTFFNDLPEILVYLHKDIEAAYQDPAAKSKREIIRSYPGFFATLAYRVANSLHRQGIEDIPRIITEYAHSKTGIDIHPGATIGQYFFIDHGTGVVIGETTLIGNHVKIFQGVTLGALSVDKIDASTKRHPTIEDHVVIYASATILGGRTVIGEGSVVGGNVWLTKSIAPGTKVYYKAAMNVEEEVDTYIFKDL